MERFEGEQVLVPGYDTVGLSRQQRTEDWRIVWIAACIAWHGCGLDNQGLGLDGRDDLPGLVRAKSQDSGHVTFKFPEDVPAKHDLVLGQAGLVNRIAQPVGREGSDQDVCVEDDLHETTRNTS